MLGVISNIQRFTVHDGPGIRITVFMQGCPLDCWWCHNPESKSYCLPEGNDLNQRMSPEKLMVEIRKELIFMEESGGGVTFSGGEPFMQTEFLSKVLDLCKEEDIHTTVDTSGMVKPEIFDALIHKPNLFLYDLKIMDAELHKKYTGVSNEWILHNLKSLVENKKNINIRLPLIPGITDIKENIDDIKKLMIGYKLKKINLLPYHRIAEGKYEKLKMENRMIGVKPHSAMEIDKIKTGFNDAGFDVKIGG